MYKFAIENNSRDVERDRSPAEWSLTRPLGSLVRWLINEWQVQRTIKQLRTFDDHMLKDIGLTRLEIDRVVRYGRSRGEL